MNTELEDLLGAILARHGTLSPRLQQVARYVLEHPNEIALTTTTELARRAGVQPSVLVRFSQAFGFPGFSGLQKVFQEALAAGAPSYAERVRRLTNGIPKATSALLRNLCEVNQVSLQNLADNLPAEDLDRAIAAIARAGTIHVMGQRRSHSLAVYLAYALMRTGKVAREIAGTAGTLAEEIRMMRAGDLLIAISIAPYSAETVEAVEWAAANGIEVVAITDGPLSPIAGAASVVLPVQDAECFGLRSLVAQTCLAQTLIIGVAGAVPAA